MKTYECNMADQALTVKSLKVLESIDGGGIREIRQSVEAVQKNAIQMLKQQEEYWKDLSDDGVISAVEKQGLKREMENIRQSYSAVTSQAASFGYTNPILQDYVRTYEALRGYIYDTLKLFDNMNEDTPIEDREYFNELFSNYFFLESFIMLAITKGVLDALSFRVLESLNEPGEEGETGLYHGGLYQYTDGRWKSVTTGAYKGARDELPGEEEEAFFLVSDTFVMTDVLIVNDTELLVNGEELGITHSYFKGYIYYCQNGIWNIVEDRGNWRYAAAFADVINVTGERPQIFQDSIDNLQSQINDIDGTLADEIAAREGEYTILAGDIVQINQSLNTKVDHLPVYLGGNNTIPQNPKEGDFFTWTGGNSDPWYKGKVYVYRNNAWSSALDPAVSANRSYYMMALQDILATSVAGEGYFTTIFANAFFANEATLQSLSTRTIYLRAGGYIQSDQSQYIPETLGLNIDYAGNIDANGKTHLGGKVAIGVPRNTSDLDNYDVVIGGNTKISGVLSGATGDFTGTINANGGTFTGTERVEGTLNVVGYLKSSGTQYNNGTVYYGADTVKIREQTHGLLYRYSGTAQSAAYFYERIATFVDALNNSVEVIWPQSGYIAEIKGYIDITLGPQYYPDNKITGDLLHIAFVKENGTLLSDTFTLWFQKYTTVYVAVFKDGNRRCEVYSVEPSSTGSYAINTRSTYIDTIDTWACVINFD